MTLLILAAGMGSRYGGLKQIDPLTEHGEFIIDFSVYDAIRSGFDKVVFVIKEENLELFRETIGHRFENKIKVEYAFQRMEDLPQGFSVPEGRVKPWGTAHALLAAQDLINEPFAVINADDFYGRSAYELLSQHFLTKKAESQYCMIGYVLENTLTENGTVSRGICEVQDGYLVDIHERTKIARKDQVAVFVEDDKEYEIPLSSIASMNCWGFSPDIFEKIRKGFTDFLERNGKELKSEYYLPVAVRDMLEKNECTVNVYSSLDPWYGVTYREDRAAVVKSLAALKENGTYPDRLNNL